jgi:hypothetical protein
LVQTRLWAAIRIDSQVSPKTDIESRPGSTPSRDFLAKEPPRDSLGSGDGRNAQGPIWTTRAWFKSHPALAFFVTIVISGLVGAVIAKGIDAV